MDANVPPVSDERDGLLRFLAQQRRVIKHAAYGLTSEQLRATPSVSALSVGALLKHVAFTERGWVARIVGDPEPSAQDDYLQQFTLADSDTVASLVAEVDAAGAATEAAVATVEDLGRAVPVPKGVPWFPQDVEAWSVRWVLLHLIEEIARHAGHADIIRESIDGAQGIELLAGAEGWPESPWIKPWRPSETV